MNEVERLAYLDVIGVVNYVPRVILPGAKPSVVCEMPEIIENPSPMPALQQGLLAPKQPVSIKPLVSKPVSAKPMPAQTPSSAPARQAAPEQQISVRFQWAIFQPAPSLLLLVPAAHLAGQHMDLLKKILGAIDVKAPALVAVENFVWPPVLHSPSGRIAINNSLAGAQETVQALLEGYQIKQKQISNVLVFDDQLGKTIFATTLFPDMQFLGMQIRLLPSLQAMTGHTPEKIAEAKKITWQKLKELKPS